jgi:hypothetical protein
MFSSVYGGGISPSTRAYPMYAANGAAQKNNSDISKTIFGAIASALAKFDVTQLLNMIVGN